MAADAWIVAGGGPAALAAARHLAGSPHPRDVLLVTDDPTLGRSRTFWPALVAGHLGPLDLARLAGRQLAGSRLRWLRAEPLGRAAGDESLLRVRTRTGEDRLSFHRLIWAVDPLPARPEVPGLDLPGAFVPRTSADCLAFAAYLDRERPRRGVVVGAGVSAVAIAAALHSRRVHITIYDGGEELLPGFDPVLARTLLPELRQAGVAFYSNAPLTALEAGQRGHRRGRLRRVGSTRTSVVADFVAVVPHPVSGVPSQAPHANPLPAEEGIFALPSTQDSGLAGEASEFWCERAGIAAAEAALGESWREPRDTGVVAFRAFGLEFARTAPPLVSGELVRTTVDSLARPAAEDTSLTGRTRNPPPGRLRFVLWSERQTGRLVAAQVAARDGAAHRARILAAGIQGGLGLADLAALDLDLAGQLAVSR